MNQEVYVRSSDLKRLFLHKKKQIYKASKIALILALLFFFFKAPVYTAKATFRQAPAKTEQVGDLKSLLQVMTIAENPSSAISVLSSDTLIEKSIYTLGLQQELKTLPLLPSLWNNIRLIFGLPPTWQEPFSFTNLLFTCETTQTFYLHFLSKESYELLDAKKHLIGQGKVGQEILTPSLSLILKEVSPHISLATLYTLRLSPLQDTLQTVKKNLKIKSHPQDKNLLELSFTHPSRPISTDFLNTHMHIYQDFLRQENQQMAEAQIAYLEKRQRELEENLDKALKDQTTYLKDNLGEKGFLDLEPELLILSKPKETYTAKLFEIDVELSRLGEEVELKKIPALSDMKGLDIPHTKQLYLKHSSHIDNLKTEIQQLTYLKEQLPEESFNLSSICYIMQDPVTQKLVEKARDLELEISDTNTHSPKEHERAQQALQTQKKCLLNHLHQTIHLKEIDKNLSEEKLSFLKSVLADLLRQEKKLILEKLKEFSAQMTDLPQRWNIENKLKIKSELATSVMEGLSQISESKNLASNLYYVESKPLDKAKTSFKPSLAPVLLFPLISSLLAGVLTFLYQALKLFFEGLPASLFALKSSGHSVCGSLSLNVTAPFTEISVEERETLRRTATFFLTQTPSFTACLGLVLQGKAPSYAPHLAHTLFLQGKRVILLDCYFDRIVSYEDIPGLWHFLTQKVAPLPIRHHPHYDHVPAGSTTSMSTELLTSPSFQALLFDLKQKYDVILLVTGASYESTEVEALFKLADATVVTLENETLEDISLFLNPPEAPLIETTESVTAPPLNRPLSPYLSSSTALVEPAIKTEIRKSLYRQKKHFPVTFIHLETHKK